VIDMSEPAHHTSPGRKMVVLGAGISGLAAARAVEARGEAPTVLESCPSPGGLTRSIMVGEFSFDYTGHLLHLARCATPSGLPFAGLRDDEWQQVSRRSFCFVGGRLVAAPLQYHLAELPEAERESCHRSYDARPPLPPVPTFRDFVVSGFGQALAELFLIPQNEKTMATRLDRLALTAVKRFFPPPDEQQVRAGLTPGTPSAPEYNSRFWYPRQGGMQRLVEGLACGLSADIRLGEEVARLDLRRRTLWTRSGRSWRWDVLFSSIPLRLLCERTDDPELRAWSEELTHSSTISFNLGIDGPLPDALQGAHWIYVPDRALPFYRVGFYSNISAGTCPAGCSSAYVEVGVPSERLASVDVAGSLQGEVLAALDRLGWVPTRRIRCCVSHVMACAYVHHTPGRERVIGAILDRLGTAGVHPIGRYGQWDYTSMEDSIESALLAVKSVC
jgi:protoporphyrinogen oxidase